MAVHNLIKKIKETGSTERRKGSGKPFTATIEENASIFEELVCSQEDEPGTHNSSRQIAPQISISKSSVHRFVKKRNRHCYKRLKNLRWIQHAIRQELNVLESFFNVLPSTLYHAPCFKMRRTFPFKYQLISKTIEFISMVPRSIRWSLLLSFRNNWWVEEKNSWCLRWVCNGSPPNPQSSETVSAPIGSRKRKRRWLNQNGSWIGINKQIYLLNTLWLFSFYEIIVSQFSCNQMKFDLKRKSEIIFWRQDFHFLQE